MIIEIVYPWFEDENQFWWWMFVVVSRREEDVDLINIQQNLIWIWIWIIFYSYSQHQECRIQQPHNTHRGSGCEVLFIRNTTARKRWIYSIDTNCENTKKHSIILSSLSSLGSVLELLLWLCDFLNCWYLWQYLW